MTVAHDLYTAACELHAHGINVIPVRSDGTKAPALKAWQQHLTTEADLEAWFAGPHPKHQALGIVTGAASENLEMAEIEGAYAHHLADLRALAHDSGVGELWDTISAGWVEATPSGGVHWFYRVTGGDIPGNTKIAQDAPVVVDGKRTVATIAETRGTGGQSVAAPTPGTAHASGRPWVRLIGGPATVPTLTWEEREAFHILLGTLDRRHVTEPAAPSPSGLSGVLGSLNAGTSFEGVTPGDDFESKRSWSDILEPHGWRILFTRGQTVYWCRPGKTFGISATTGHADDRDRLFVFSSSTEFETHTPYTKLGAYALLNHGGDHSAAASALRKSGFGESPTAMQQRVQAQQQSTAATTDGTEQQMEMFPVIVAERPTQWGDTGLRSHQRIAARLATRAQGKYLYVSGIGWHQWNGVRWALDHRSTHINRELTELLKISWVEAFHDKDLAADVKAAMTANGTRGVLELASVRPELCTQVVDRDPWLLNTPSGTIDLHTLELRPHNPDDRITKVTGASFNPDAVSPTWERFLESSLPDPEVRGFLQRYCGMALIGKVIDHVLVIAHGSGRNGKGVFSHTISQALGAATATASYAIVSPSDLLVQSRYGEKRSAGELAAIMRLRGARWVTMSELPKGVAMDEATMKSLTGGDTITAKNMGRDPVEFEPSHTIFMAANDLPSVGADSIAAWARIRTVPWTVTWLGREDTTLESRLQAELEGVLAWMVQGLRQYQQGGLQAPPAVIAANESYRAENDPVAKFVAERCFVSPAASVTRSALLDAYTKWARINGEPAMNGRQFAALVRARPGVSEYKAGTLAWRGLGLSQEMEPAGFGEPEPPSPVPFDGDRGGY